ncbi:hypothetical protein ACFL0H_05045 [Thermodesulfobacteriota bacterium]
MTTKLIEVLDPTAKAVGVGLEIAPRIDDLNGKVIGLLDNGKPNFDIFLARIEELLCQRFKFSDVVRVSKGGGMSGAARLSVEQMDNFAAKCDAVVNGMCD